MDIATGFAVILSPDSSSSKRIGFNTSIPIVHPKLGFNYTKLPIGLNFSIPHLEIPPLPPIPPAISDLLFKLSDVFAYVIVFSLFFVVLRQLLKMARKNIFQPKPKIKIDSFVEEYGYSYDFAFVFKVLDEGALKETVTQYQKDFSMKNIVDRLQRAGFETQCFYSCQRDEIYVKVRCKMHRIQIEASKMDYKLMLDPGRLKVKAQAGVSGIWGKIMITDEYGVSVYEPWEYIYGPYRDSPEMHMLYKEYKFIGGKKYPFREVDRMKIMLGIMETKVSDNGCGLFLENLLFDGACLAIMPIHNFRTLDALQLKWFHLFSYPWKQPLTDIKNYYGERIGLYFAYLGYYCAALMTMGSVGAVCFILQKVNPGDHGAMKGTEHPILPVFAVAMTIWAAAYVEYWKQYQSKLAMEWGMTGFESAEPDRPQFQGLEITNPANGEPWTFFPSAESNKRKQLVMAVIFFSIVIVIVSVAVTFYLKFLLTTPFLQALLTVTVGPITYNVGGIIIPVINAVLIAVLNVTYTKTAYEMNDYENHRTATQYENGLVAKVFIFQLINSFAALIYIAFIQGWLGWSFHCTGPRGNCTKDVASTVSIVFISRELSAMVTEIFLRAGAQKKKEDEETSGLEPGTAASPLELQYCKAQYDITKNALVDYAGLVIQYGYMVMFVAAFPLSVLLACFSSYIQIRIDGWKFCQMFRRPLPKSAEDIGMWQDMIEIISVLGVSTNMALIFFTGFYFEMLTWQMRWVLFILSEHALFCFKIFCSVSVEEVTEDVGIQLQRTDFLVSKVIENLKDDIDTAYEDDGNAALSIVIERTDNGWDIPEEVEEEFKPVATEE